MEGRQARTGGGAGMGTLICCRLVWGSQELDTPLLRQLTVGADKRSNSFPYGSELQEISEECSLS